MLGYCCLITVAICELNQINEDFAPLSPSKLPLFLLLSFSSGFSTAFFGATAMAFTGAGYFTVGSAFFFSTTVDG